MQPPSPVASSPSFPLNRPLAPDRCSSRSLAFSHGLHRPSRRSLRLSSSLLASSDRPLRRSFSREVSSTIVPPSYTLRPSTADPREVTSVGLCHLLLQPKSLALSVKLPERLLANVVLRRSRRRSSRSSSPRVSSFLLSRPVASIKLLAD